VRDAERVGDCVCAQRGWRAASSSGLVIHCQGEVSTSRRLGEAPAPPQLPVAIRDIASRRAWISGPLRRATASGAACIGENGVQRSTSRSRRSSRHSRRPGQRRADAQAEVAGCRL
jgi:hypothetical protein